VLFIIFRYVRYNLSRKKAHLNGRLSTRYSIVTHIIGPIVGLMSVPGTKGFRERIIIGSDRRLES